MKPTNHYLRFLASMLSLAATASLCAQESLLIARAGSQAPTEAPAEHFTGRASVERFFDPQAPSRIAGASVSFAPGARSHWHTHDLGQTLIVTAGSGRIQRWGGPVQDIRAGDVIHTPPGVKHWHGATPDAAMTHVSIVERPESGSGTVWLEGVSDEQYAGTIRAVGAGEQPSRAQQLMGDIAPQLAGLTDEVLYGQVWADPALSQRDRSLVTVSALIAMNRPDQLRSHLGIARRNGLTQEELVAAITQLAFYSGWPNSVTAVSVARAVFDEEMQ